MVDMLKSACRLYFPNVRCESCGSPLSVVTRSEYSSLIGTIRRFGKSSLTPLCILCSTDSNFLTREDDGYILKSPADHVANAVKRLQENAKPIDYAQLTFSQSFLLYAALLAANLAPGHRTVPPLEIQIDELAPTAELAEEIYGRLCTCGIFLPVLTSNLDAFSLDKDTGAVIVNIQKGWWTLVDDIEGRSVNEIIELLFQRLDQPEPKEVEALWYLVAEHECRKYFMRQWDRYRFSHPEIYSSKAAAALKLYLDQCSIGQTWNIVYYSVKNLAALAQEGRHTPQHIYNMLPGSIRRYADYRLANGQSIRPWHRPTPTNAAWVTNILLDKILKAGDVCFEMLKGNDVTRYVEHLITKPIDCSSERWFSVPQNNPRSE